MKKVISIKSQQNDNFVELHEIPNYWRYCNLQDISYNIGTKNNQIKQSSILKKGKYPVVSQSLNRIEGYSNDKTKLLKNPNVIIVFGDHSKTLKYIDFDFIIGADGTKLLVPIHINAYFLYYVLKYNLINLPTKDYGRHFNLLSLYKIPLPSLEEQKRIVAILDALLPLCEVL